MPGLTDDQMVLLARAEPALLISLRLITRLPPKVELGIGHWVIINPVIVKENPRLRNIKRKFSETSRELPLYTIGIGKPEGFGSNMFLPDDPGFPPLSKRPGFFKSVAIRSLTFLFTLSFSFFQ